MQEMMNKIIKPQLNQQFVNGQQINGDLEDENIYAETQINFKDFKD